jgi:hypothetical protein
VKTLVVALAVAAAYALAFLAVMIDDEHVSLRINMAATVALGVAVLGGVLL